MRILSSCKTTGLLASSTKFIFLAFQVSDHSHTESEKRNRKETIMNEMTRKKRVGGRGRGEGGRGSKELKSGLYQRDWPLQKFKFANFLS